MTPTELVDCGDEMEYEDNIDKVKVELEIEMEMEKMVINIKLEEERWEHEVLDIEGEHIAFQLFDRVHGWRVGLRDEPRGHSRADSRHVNEGECKDHHDISQPASRMHWQARRSGRRGCVGSRSHVGREAKSCN